ncbi:hypothetical protein [uncultured Paraglaciecola sp.]|uniref:hypothetical protein n=1 Tax=uncultured Paraglaciecola sp. TaxID=1765024 RepID=UPI00261D5E44|nr:hypothetical protein [uncultured Paraglaciecola sp.]
MIRQVKMPNGEIIDTWDESEINLDPSKPSSASFLERGRAGLAQSTPDAQLEAWRTIRGADNVKRDEAGAIFLRDGNDWKPVDSSEWSVSETLGDIADYSGDAVEDIGAGVGAGVAGLATLPAFNPVVTAGSVSAGGGAGRMVGNIARQGLSKIADVDSGESSALSQIAGAGVEGAITEPLALAGGKAVQGVAEAVGPYVKKGLSKIGQGGASVFTMQGPDLTGDLLSEGGEQIMSKVQRGSAGYLDTAEQATEIPQFMYSKASQRYVDELGDGGIDMTAPATPDSIMTALNDIYTKHGIGSGKKLTSISDDSEVSALLNDIPELAADIATPQDAMIFKQNMADRLAKTGYFSKSSKDKTHYENAIKSLYDSSDGIIESAAARQGKQKEYNAAKKSFSDRAKLSERFGKWFKNIDTSGATIRNMEGKAKRGLFADLQKAADMEPELKPLLDEMMLSSKADRIDPNIGSMGSTRPAASIIGNIDNPVKQAAIAIGTRPEFFNQGIVKAGQTGRKLSSIAGDVSTNPELTKIAPRIAVGQAPIMSETTGLSRIDGPPTVPQVSNEQLMDFARIRYGANYKRALDQGLSDQDAANKVITDLVAKGKISAIANGLGLTMPQTKLLLGAE